MLFKGALVWGTFGLVRVRVDNSVGLLLALLKGVFPVWRWATLTVLVEGRQPR